MRIIVVADHAWISGGQAKVSIESSLGLAARGHEVTYFAAVGPVDPRLENAGVEVICLGQGDITNSSKAGFLVQTLWNTTANRELARVLDGRDPATTVVHTHAWAKAVSPSIGPVLHRCGLARVYTMHEYFMVCPTGGFYDYRKRETCRRTPMSLDCVTTMCDSKPWPYKVARMARRKIMDFGGLWDAFPHVIAISQLQFDAVRPHMPPSTVWHRVDNPVESEDRGAKSTSGADFVFVGRVSPEKGVKHFCEAARRAGVVAHIHGDGPQQAELEAAYPEAVFHGWVKPEGVRDVLRAARALVFPSVWYEGQPLTVLESLAEGTPTIVSDICAGREQVRDGENGLWFASADPDSLARALRRLSDDTEAARMSAAAHRLYWENPFTLDRHLDAVEAVYRAAIADARKAAA